MDKDRIIKATEKSWYNQEKCSQSTLVTPVISYILSFISVISYLLSIISAICYLLSVISVICYLLAVIYYQCYQLSVLSVLSLISYPMHAIPISPQLIQCSLSRCLRTGFIISEETAPAEDLAVPFGLSNMTTTCCREIVFQQFNGIAESLQIKRFRFGFHITQGQGVKWCFLCPSTACSSILALFAFETKPGK